MTVLFQQSLKGLAADRTAAEACQVLGNHLAVDDHNPAAAALSHQVHVRDQYLNNVVDTRKAASRLSLPVVRALRESALLLFGTLALILLTALVTYDPHDPGFSFTGEPGHVSNSIGPVGAWFADVLLFLFGRAAFLFPVMLALAGWVIYRAHTSPDIKSRSTLTFRGLGFVLTLATSCGLANLHWNGVGLPSGAGGVLGSLVGNGLASAFSFLGATLLMLALWFAGVALFLGVSWFNVMLDGGCDPLYIARRVVRMASEDIGNADPRALALALAAWDTYERLGSPEGELAIAQVIVYLACAPKSNAVYTAYGSAMEDVHKYGTLEVPLQLRNAPTGLMKKLGFGKAYRYAHHEPDAFAAGERYFPEAMPAHTYYYHPVPRGLEIRIAEALERLRQRNASATEKKTP